MADLQRQLDAIDGQMMDAASDWGVLAGIPMDVFSRAGAWQTQCHLVAAWQHHCHLHNCRVTILSCVLHFQILTACHTDLVQPQPRMRFQTPAGPQPAS